MLKKMGESSRYLILRNCNIRVDLLEPLEYINELTLDRSFVEGDVLPLPEVVKINIKIYEDTNNIQDPKWMSSYDIKLKGRPFHGRGLYVICFKKITTRVMCIDI